MIWGPPTLREPIAPPIAPVLTMISVLFASSWRLLALPPPMNPLELSNVTVTGVATVPLVMQTSSTPGVGKLGTIPVLQPDPKFQGPSPPIQDARKGEPPKVHAADAGLAPMDTMAPNPNSRQKSTLVAGRRYVTRTRTCSDLFTVGLLLTRFCHVAKRPSVNNVDIAKETRLWP